MRGRASIAVLLTAALATVAGCGPFHRLKKDLAEMEAGCTIRGQVSGALPGRGRVIVFVLRTPAPGIAEFMDVAPLAPEEVDFAFVVPLAEDYFVGAFQDLDANERRDEGEPVFVTGKPVRFDGARRSEPIAARLSPDGLKDVPPDLIAAVARGREGRSVAGLSTGHEVPIALGDIADLDAPRFAAAAGQVGLWQPLHYMNEYGVGVFFLEAYDPKRLPVLFVFGASGSPQDFRHFFEHLDRSRYQAWFFLYPSGLRLATSSRILLELVTQLHDELDFDRLAVVAHSMGGLVARSFVLAQAERFGWVERFATLSTPWGGHEAAALGVEHAPAAVPSWIDVQPGSEFQKRIFAQSLGPKITQCLGFTFHGEERMFLPHSNDGVVSVASELRAEAQADADQLRGFDATHTGVLREAEALAFVEGCLADGEEDR